MIKDNKQKKTLSIRISTNGFCFCTYIKSQPGSLKYFTYLPDVESSMASNLQAAFESAPPIRLQEDEYEIKAIIETGEYTCIPAEYDNTEEYKQFFNYCFPKSENAEVIANKLNAYGQTILFPVDAGVCETLQKYGNVTFYTPASIIMSYLSYKPIEKEQYMLAYLYNDYAFILTMKNGKVGMSNIFKKEEKENTLFYMLSIWKEQGLSQTEDYLYLCGDNSIEAFSPIAGQFIKNIKRINPNELFSPSLLNRTEGIPFDLQALILCE